MPELIQPPLTQLQRQSGIWRVIIWARPPPVRGQQGSAVLKQTRGYNWLAGVEEEEDSGVWVVVGGWVGGCCSASSQMAPAPHHGARALRPCFKKRWAAFDGGGFVFCWIIHACPRHGWGGPCAARQERLEWNMQRFWGQRSLGAPVIRIIVPGSVSSRSSLTPSDSTLMKSPVGLTDLLGLDVPDFRSESLSFH